MRITRLTVTGFGPFKDTQVVDFRSFDDDGLFLITGRTGAGKSSILDAICFALYGSAPRYDGAEQKLRSDHSAPDDPTVVELEFTVDDAAYRVVRSPAYERAKRNGTGTTPQKATAQLFERVDGSRDGDDGWQGIGAKPSDVGPELLRIVGLTREQFLQVILLAQNRFQDFLSAKNDDRQKVLRNLFGTRRFEQLEVAVVERRKALDARISSARETLALNAGHAAALLQRPVPDYPDLDWFENGFLALSAERADAELAARHATETLSEREAHYRALETVSLTQQRRDRARARLASLDGESRDVDAVRQELAAARRAAILSPSIAATVAAERELEHARRQHETAAAAFEAVLVDAGAVDGGAVDGGPARSTPDELRSVIAETTRTLGMLDEALTDERSIPALRSETDRLDGLHRATRDAVHLLEDRAHALPTELDALAERVEHLQVLAGSERTLGEEVDRVEAMLRAAHLVAELEPEQSAAGIRVLDAASAKKTATGHALDLVQRRFAGYAAELAGRLSDGEPCLVCGSTDHPAPATGDQEPVTEADVDAAHAEEARASRVLEQLLAASADVTRRIDEARARSGDEGVGRLTERLIDARSDLAEARNATRELTVLLETRGRLRTESVELSTRLADARAEVEALGSDLAGAGSRLKEVEERVRRSLGGQPSVEARAVGLRALLASATDLLTAVTAVAARLETAESAARVLEQHLAEQRFDSASAALEATRSAVETATAERRIREFDDGVAAASSTLAEAEIVAAPEPPVDLDPAAALVAEARTWRDDTAAQAAALQARVDQLNGIVTAAHAEFANTAKLHDEHRQLSELANALEGKEPNDKRMRLETYVLAARLEEIVAAANSRLRTMTGGRYALEHDDALQYRGVQSGLGLLIRDEHTGRTRPTHSLSGGETFLASLALALGLAEVVTNQAGGIRLDTLFVDEGFGTLDAETLAIAMGTLDGLRAGGRTVGLISHVEAMKEQIPAKLHVSVTADGCSEISTAYELAR